MAKLVKKSKGKISKFLMLEIFILIDPQVSFLLHSYSKIPFLMHCFPPRLPRLAQVKDNYKLDTEFLERSTISHVIFHLLWKVYYTNHTITYIILTQQKLMNID